MKAQRDLIGIYSCKSNKTIAENIWIKAYDDYQVNPLLTYLSVEDIKQLNYIALSSAMNCNVKRKYEKISELLNFRGFRVLGGGTNRRIYECIYDNRICLKVATDRGGMDSNIKEYYTQNVLKPFCHKVFEVTPCGTISLSEKIIPIKDQEEFKIYAEDIFDMLYYKIRNNDIAMDDIGTRSFKNWGYRNGFGPVLLDFPTMYVADSRPEKKYCHNIVKDANGVSRLCNGTLDYDDCFNKIICSDCHRTYTPDSLAKVGGDDINTLLEAVGYKNMNRKDKKKMDVMFINSKNEVVLDTGKMGGTEMSAVNNECYNPGFKPSEKFNLADKQFKPLGVDDGFTSYPYDLNTVYRGEELVSNDIFDIKEYIKKNNCKLVSMWDNLVTDFKKDDNIIYKYSGPCSFDMSMRLTFYYNGKIYSRVTSFKNWLTKNWLNNIDLANGKDYNIYLYYNKNNERFEILQVNETLVIHNEINTSPEKDLYDKYVTKKFSDEEKKDIKDKCEFSEGEIINIINIFDFCIDEKVYNNIDSDDMEYKYKLKLFADMIEVFDDDIKLYDSEFEYHFMRHINETENSAKVFRRILESYDNICNNKTIFGEKDDEYNIFIKKEAFNIWRKKIGQIFMSYIDFYNSVGRLLDKIDIYDEDFNIFPILACLDYKINKNISSYENYFYQIELHDSDDGYKYLLDICDVPDGLLDMRNYLNSANDESSDNENNEVDYVEECKKEESEIMFDTEASDEYYDILQLKPDLKKDLDELLLEYGIKADSIEINISKPNEDTNKCNVRLDIDL